MNNDLFHNPKVLKLTGCKYSFEPGTVSIYYDLHTDLFGIVSEKPNKFLAGGVASLTDYIDIYYFKSLEENKTYVESRNSDFSTFIAKPRTSSPVEFSKILN